MSRMNKLLLYSGTGLCVFIFLVCLAFVINSKKSKENLDVLKHVDISHNSYLISPIISELHRITGRREPNLRFPGIGGRMRLRDSFQKLQETGKATAEEVEAIKEFEKTMDDLSKAIQKLGSIPSLRSEMRL